MAGWFFDEIEEELLRVVRLVVKGRALVRQVELEGPGWPLKSMTFDTRHRKTAIANAGKLAFELGEHVLDSLPEGIAAEVVLCFTHEVLYANDRATSVAWEVRPVST